MKVLHIADLHVGKRIFGYSLIEDQRFFFKSTVELVKNRNIEVVMIAGDIFDNGNPSAEAMALLDEFLTELSSYAKVLLIPGNHDVALRFNYGSSFFKKGGVYMVNDVKDSLKPIVINDVNFYLVPFINHHDVNRLLNTDCVNTEEAFIELIKAMNIDNNKINICIAHQLVLPTSGDLLKEGSEDIVLGTTGNISSRIFSSFSYVALGHIHKPQTVGKMIRYSGSPLAYHSDEAKIEKSYTILNIDSEIAIDFVPIKPLRNVTILKGSLEDVLKNHPQALEDYVYVKLTDLEQIDNVMNKIKNVYKYALNVEFERFKAEGVKHSNIDVEDIKLDDLFYSFYEKQNGTKLTEYQKNIVDDLLKEVKLK